MSQSNMRRLDKKKHSLQKLSTLKEPYTASKKSSEYFAFLGCYFFLNIVSIKINSTQGSSCVFGKTKQNKKTEITPDLTN